MSANRTIQTNFLDGVQSISNYIGNGKATYLNTAGWATYAETDSVTFQDIGDTVTLNSHNLQNGNTISFTSITSTTGISINTLYYVISVTTNTFQVASSSGGSALALTTNGSGTMVRFIPKTGATGGSPNITFTTSFSSPLSGDNSFLFNKDAANRMGQGVSYDFTINSSDQAKVLQIQFDYILSSGTFTAGSSTTDSDVTVWIYDVTNAVLIQPSTFRLYSNSSTTSTTSIGSFQTASNSTSYRLIFHVGSTSASAYTLKVDNVSVSPTSYVYGTPITDIVDKGSITLSATTTAPTKGTVGIDKMLMKRYGDVAEITYEYNQTTAGTTGSGSYLFSLPSGMSFDTTKIVTSGGTILNALRSTVTPIGYGTIGSTAASGFNGNVVLVAYNSTQFYAHVTSSQNTSGTGDPAVDDAAGSGNYAFNDASYGFKFVLKAPIQGFSSSVQMSDSADTRVVDFVGNKGSTQAVTGDVTNVTFTANKDSHGAWNGSQYVVPVSGDYSVSGMVFDSASATTETKLYINEILSRRYLAYSNAGVPCSPGTLLVPNLKAGDTISVRSSNTMTLAANGSLSIMRISGPSAIAATETIAASYKVVTGTTATAGSAINYDTKEYDTHNAMSSGTFTAPAAGIYQVDVSHATGVNTRNFLLYKNGTLYRNIFGTNGAQASNDVKSGSTTVKLLAGDTVFITINTTTTLTSDGTNTVATANHMSIFRIGL